MCEPVDVPVSKRHLDMVYAHLRYSDKPFMGSVTAGQPRRGQLRAGAHRVRRRPRRPHRDDEPHQRVVAARVGRLDARGGARSTPSTTRRRSSRRSSSPARWRPTTSAAVAAQTLAEALAGHDVRAARAARRAGDVRVVRELDVDADRRADVRHARAGDRAVHVRRARPSPRRAVPLRRRAHRVEAARRAGGVRVGVDAASRR